MLLQWVAPNGFLTFVLPGTPMGFWFMHDIRKIIVNMSRKEWNIIAPCPHHAECPMAKDSQNWCHFD